MYSHDIATTFQLLGFMRYIPLNEGFKVGLCVNWSKVDAHMKKISSSPRLVIDPECLRWTPLLTTNINSFSPEVSSDMEAFPENLEDSAKYESISDEEPKVNVSKVITKNNNTNVYRKLDLNREPEKSDDTILEVTSSGRKRTRPSKYNETTYTVPVLNSDTTSRRKRKSIDELSLKKGRSIEINKVKKADSPNGIQVENNNRSVTRSQQSSSHKKPTNQKLLKNSKVLLLKQKKIKAMKNISALRSKKTEEFSENQEKKMKNPTLNSKNSDICSFKRKRGWVRGRPRKKIDAIKDLRKQTTITEMLKNRKSNSVGNKSYKNTISTDFHKSMEKYSENESDDPSQNVESESSSSQHQSFPTSENVSAQPPLSSKESENNVRERQASGNETTEDSSAEADDEMEIDENDDERKSYVALEKENGVSNKDNHEDHISNVNKLELPLDKENISKPNILNNEISLNASVDDVNSNNTNNSVSENNHNSTYSNIEKSNTVKDNFGTSEKPSEDKDTIIISESEECSNSQTEFIQHKTDLDKNTSSEKPEQHEGNEQEQKSPLTSSKTSNENSVTLSNTTKNELYSNNVKNNDNLSTSCDMPIIDKNDVIHMNKASNETENIDNSKSSKEFPLLDKNEPVMTNVKKFNGFFQSEAKCSKTYNRSVNEQQNQNAIDESHTKENTTTDIKQNGEKDSCLVDSNERFSGTSLENKTEKFINENNSGNKSNENSQKMKDVNESQINCSNNFSDKTLPEIGSNSVTLSNKSMETIKHDFSSEQVISCPKTQPSNALSNNNSNLTNNSESDHSLKTCNSIGVLKMSGLYSVDSQILDKDINKSITPAPIVSPCTGHSEPNQENIKMQNTNEQQIPSEFSQKIITTSNNPMCSINNPIMSTHVSTIASNNSIPTSCENTHFALNSITDEVKQDNLNVIKPVREKSKLRDVRVNSAHNKLDKGDKKMAKPDTNFQPSIPQQPKTFFSEQEPIKKPSEPINTINANNVLPVGCKTDNKMHDSTKKPDFYKKEKAVNAKSSDKGSVSKHEKGCSKPDQTDVNVNKSIPKFKYESDLVGKTEYALNQIPNYHSTHPQYQWWDPTRLHGSWDQNRYLDIKNTEKPYYDKYQSFNLTHLDNMPKSPQKHKYDQKDFHNLAYTTLSASTFYQATSLAPPFKEAKTPQSKTEYNNQKTESCKVASRQSKNSGCQSQCDNKTKNSINAFPKDNHIKQIMDQHVSNQNKAANDVGGPPFNMSQTYERQNAQIINSSVVNSQCKNNSDHYNHTSVSTHQTNSSPCGIQEKSRNDSCEKKNSHQTCKKEEMSKDNTSQQISSQKEEICQSVSPALPSMGVYTPDSTSNSVHSVQYNPCELDVSQLGLESPSSIASDLASPCSMLHMHPSPQHVPHPIHSSIHIPPIMTGNQGKQKNVHNRNR